MYEILEKDVFDKKAPARVIERAPTWENACKVVDQIRDARPPRLNLRYGLEIREEGGRP